MAGTRGPVRQRTVPPVSSLTCRLFYARIGELRKY